METLNSALPYSYLFLLKLFWRKFVVFAIYLLWCAAVLDPVGGFYGLRYLALASFLFVVCINFFLFFKFKLKVSLRLLICIYLAFVMPIYGLFLYSFNASTEPLRDTSYIAAGVLILSSYLYSNLYFSKVGLRAMIFSLRFLVILILGTFISIGIGGDVSWISVFTESDVALVSTREYAGVRLPYIYFLASPMLIYLICYELNNFILAPGLGKVLLAIASSMALLLSGTRAHMILAGVIPLFFYIMLFPKKISVVVLSLISICVVVIIVIDSSLISAFFSASETSNSMKLGMIGGYLNIFSNMATFIGGQGFNAYEWSLELRNMIVLEDYATKTELTYVELIRVYGVLVSAPFFFILFFLIKEVSMFENRYRWLYPSVFIYLLNSFLNPYLFSTNGILPLALLVSLAFFLKKNKK